MKKIVLTPNPYRDRNFKYVTLADKLLREAGLETRICLAFDVDRSFELPDNVVLTELNHELRDADLLVCFGGDGTILHASKAATKAGIPVLGVNIGTMGFMAELESSELKELRRLADDDFSVEPRMSPELRELYMTAYSLQSTSEYIYQNISKKLETFFAPYLPGAQASDFYELEIASAGVMRGFMGRPCDLYFTIERKLRRFLSCCMRLYCVPEEKQE